MVLVIVLGGNNTDSDIYSMYNSRCKVTVIVKSKDRRTRCLIDGAMVTRERGGTNTATIYLNTLFLWDVLKTECRRLNQTAFSRRRRSEQNETRSSPE